MKSQDILYPKWNNNEMYTPRYAVEPVLKYMPYVAIYNDLYWFSIFLKWWKPIEKIVHYNDNLKSLPWITTRKPIIWCPFDTEESKFVKVFRDNWYKVIASHIDNWQDFYNYEPEEWDIIISNPPFTNKRKIFERALSFNKPFLLLMSLTWLNDSAPKQLFMEKDLQLLMFDKRIKFTKPDWTIDNKITFSSAYYWYDFLPKQIIMEKL